MALAAGRAERMEPLSTLVPKPALDVLGQPLVASALGHLRRAGCRRIVVNLHRHPEAVAAAVRDADDDTAFSWEPVLLGGAGGVAAARPFFGPGPLLVANADVWAELDLGPVLAAGEEDTIVLALLRHPDPTRWSSVVLDDAGRVQTLLPPGAPHKGERYLFTGFQLLGSSVLASLSDSPGEMAPLWEKARRQGALRGVTVEGSWSEVGTPGAYRELVTSLVTVASWIHPQAAVADGARVMRSAVGAGCRVAAEAHVSETILTAGASVEAGCELARCVLAGPVTLTGADTASEALILPGGRFPLR
ncbi:MAG TPA: sugar phosphate nucleotidyltransferase [Thermoanaerobaculaceae bacterium]|nr:sugar phosphate nucleotidyltransferase [Thermoanaerobaculaceae bacterium]